MGEESEVGGGVSLGELGLLELNFLKNSEVVWGGFAGGGLRFISAALVCVALGPPGEGAGEAGLPFPKALDGAAGVSALWFCWCSF